MVSSYALSLGAVLTFMVAVSQAGYSIIDEYNSYNFFDQFDFWNTADPTNGFVQYVDRVTAQNNGLISNAGSVHLGVDHKTVSSNGRASVRLTSRKSYTHGLFVADIVHMPGGICGTWPAFWTVGPDWPKNGEIDIIEQVNRATNNRMTLHTADGCFLDGGTQLGSTASVNCFAYANGNEGCGVGDHRPQSYGSIFNQGGGGVYAMEWTSQHIQIWFWPRNEIPDNALSNNPDPGQWGEPAARFQGGCDIDSHFAQHQIVFDTTFCGDWAGNAWSSSGCTAAAASCADYVAHNPSAFVEAYWDIHSVKVFRMH